MRGNRYSVPAALAGQLVRVRITLDGHLAVYAGEECVAQHTLHARLRLGDRPRPPRGAVARTLAVEQRPLAVYEEVAQWS